VTPGARLGPYEILAVIGAGGMGEVYRARDTRLDRTVALKVLHARADAAASAFPLVEREARAAAALNHPHICTLYDIGHEGDFGCLVTVITPSTGSVLSSSAAHAGGIASRSPVLLIESLG
jgi:serine/threonine protein kinase